jgi:putative sterol carrier protein
MQLITPEWAAAYAEAWNNDDEVMKKLRKFSSVFKYSISDREDLEPVVLEVEKGICVTFGTEEQYEKIEFDMWADSASWKKVFDGEISVKKAMMSKGFGFKGPKLKAMMNMGGFERSIAIMVEMDGVTV